MVKILIVEDEAAIALELEKLLAALGYEVAGSVANGKKAVATAEQLKPDLILMDIVMPGELDGIDAAQIIRKQLDIPVIFLTAHADNETLKRAKVTEPLGYIIKPFQEADIRSAVEVALHKKETERRLRESEQALRKTHAELALRLEERDAIFRSVNASIITVDRNLRVISANAATQDICKFDPKKAIGKLFNDLNTPCHKACLEVLLETLQTKTAVKEYHIECRQNRRSRKLMVLNTTTLLDQDSRFIGIVMVIRDITRLNDLEQALRDRHQFHNITGRSRKMRAIYSLLEDLADTETTVLITGESGTGKEVVTQALHFNSVRAFYPLVKVNCSALAESMLESELFGHVRGAFTGAIKDKIGRFQSAHQGTILLDEIGEISPMIQLKLLRVLQEKEFERVGDSTTVKVDVRVITTTNCDLLEKVNAGTFREDLYYRLKVVEIKLPPLRERSEDIPLLVDNFIDAFNKKFKKQISGISLEVLRIFMNHTWPGNVRELEHAIEHAFVLCHQPTITSRDLPRELLEQTQGQNTPPAAQAALVQDDILQALQQTGWNKARAARLLNMDRKTIYRKIKKYGLKQA